MKPKLSWWTRLYRGEAPQPPRVWMFDETYRDPIMRADTARSLNQIIDNQRQNLTSLRHLVAGHEQTIANLQSKIDKLEWLLHGRLDGEDFERVARDEAEA